MTAFLLSDFLKKNPAFLYALWCFAGVFGAFGEWFALLFIAVTCSLLWILTPERRPQVLVALILSLSITLFTFTTIQLPKRGRSEGVASVKIDRVDEVKRRVYGRLLTFTSYEGSLLAKNIPFSSRFKSQDPLPGSDRRWFVDGELIESDRSNTQLKADRRDWVPKERLWTLEPLRKSLKRRLQRWITDHSRSERAASFLYALVTGELSDPVIRRHLSHLNLQHLVAISGFHFTLLFCLLALTCRLFFSTAVTTSLVLALLSFYTLLVGGSPSILRAFVMIGVVLVAGLRFRRSFSVNSLGISALLLLFYDPLVAREIGFQFSFLVTLSLLLFQPISERWISQHLKRRSLKEIQALTFFDQHLYLLVHYLRGVLSLQISAWIVALPLQLYTFGAFSVWSLFFSTFFPLCTAGIVLLLFLALFLSWSSVGGTLLSLTSFFADRLLVSSQCIPPSLDFVLRWQPPALLLLCYFTGLLFFTLAAQKKKSLDSSHDKAPFDLLSPSPLSIDR